MADQKLSTQPYKGARDFYPEDMRVRNYIFETWKKVCKRYGYEEYDGPFLESFDIYAAKTGEEIVNEQLYSFEDRAGRKVAIRPEMTPTLARMVAAKYKELPRPIRWFSVPNLWRYEKPQKGRLREHFQLNVDVFGIGGIEADYEVISLAVEIMKTFGATKNMYEIRIGNRRLIEDVYKKFGITKEQGKRVSKAIDKKNKISQEDFEIILKEDAKINSSQIDSIIQFLDNPSPTVNSLINMSKGAREVTDLLNLLNSENEKNTKFKYDPTIVRGIEYYTGNVFEQFDLNPNNNRAMYGGGRYDDLVEIFTGNKLPGVGFGMGDVTMQIFLENWGLLPNFESETQYFVTLWPEENKKYLEITLEIARKLREMGKNVQTWLEKGTKIDKQLKYADKKGIDYAVIVGEKEIEDKTVTIKDLKTQKQETKPFTEWLGEIS